MIEKKTVLVLGAGASHDYGYPLGRELVEQILVNINDKNEGNWVSFLLQDLKIEDLDIIVGFQRALYGADIPSIDEFLENRSEFMNIGKLSIALALIPIEEEDRLFNLTIRRKSWYQYLWSRLRVPKLDYFNPETCVKL